MLAKEKMTNPYIYKPNESKNIISGMLDIKKTYKEMDEAWKINNEAIQYILDHPEESPIIIEEVDTDLLSCGTTIRRYRLRNEND